MPASQRRNAGIKGRQAYARQQRAKRYGALWLRLKASMTREDFFAIGAEIAEREWANGYSAAFKDKRKAKQREAA